MAVAQANEKRGGVEVDEAPKGLAILGMIGPGIVWAGLAIGFSETLTGNLGHVLTF
jgi:hypothetical protein